MSIIVHHVRNLRAKPEHERRRWAIGLSAVATGIIAVVWMTNLSFTLGTPQVAEAPSPFSQVATVAAANLDAVKDGFVTVISGLYHLIIP